SLLSEELKNLWTPFYRLDKARNREGHGLGLSIVKGILQRHNSKFGADIIKGKLKIWFQLRKKTFF
ncbi:MAG: ATP-binding protein, partial [Cetobacterium sp.]